MKLSVKIPDGDDGRAIRHVTDPGGYRHRFPIIKAEIPISVLSYPFTSAIATATTTPSDHLALSLSSAFSAGPTLKFYYSPSAPPASQFALTLKSGLGSFGSPIDSPLVFRAHLPLSNPNPSVPIFSVHFKPRIGNFCLRKSAFSNPCPSNQNPKLKSSTVLDPVPDGGNLNMEATKAKTLGGQSLDGGIGNQVSSAHWEELKLEPVENTTATGNSIVSMKSRNNGGALFPGVSFRARTALPITKRYAMKLRWGLNLPLGDSATMPYLTVQKIEIERAAEAEVDGVRGSKVGDSEIDREICVWMKKDLEAIKEENREMKQLLEDMRVDSGKRVQNRSSRGVPSQLSKKT